MVAVDLFGETKGECKMNSHLRTAFLDIEERQTVLKILEGLPAQHPARIAADNGANTIQIARMVDDVEVAEQLKQAFLAACSRMLIRDALRRS
jgi:hypothetical protein